MDNAPIPSKVSKFFWI